MTTNGVQENDVLATVEVREDEYSFEIESEVWGLMFLVFTSIISPEASP